jgi:hypothetical protein
MIKMIYYMVLDVNFWSVIFTVYQFYYLIL